MTTRIDRTFSLIAAAALLVLALGGCASTSTQRSTTEYVDDTALTARVKTAFAESPEVKAYQVDIEAYRGVVQLNGFVDTASAKAAATTVAKGVDGVTEVRNNLVVGRDASAGEVVDDGVIVTKVKAALVADPATKAAQINVSASEGVVQLAGFVDSGNEKSRAGEIARGIEGVRDVRNELDVK
jgi:hyperosmotically inducible protein